MVGRLSGEAIPILCEHHGYPASGHQVSHAVHAGSLEACPTLFGILNLLEDLVALSGDVVSEGPPTTPASPTRPRF